MMGEELQGQRTGDDISLRVSATCHTFDEALSWIVRQLDHYRLRAPQGGFSPVWHFCDGDEDPEIFFEVWVAGTPVAGAA